MSETKLMTKNFDPEIGKDTRWRKGQLSPNPGGRPKYRVVSAYLRQALEAGDADKIACSLLKLAKKGNMRAISEVIDRTEGKATQTMEVAVENSERYSPDLRNMSRDELNACIIETGVSLIANGLEALHDEHSIRMLHLRKEAPRLRELHQELTFLHSSVLLFVLLRYLEFSLRRIQFPAFRPQSHPGLGELEESG
jgi:hypothetical protein